MNPKASIFLVCAVGIAVSVICLNFVFPSELRLSVQFLAYTNMPDYGEHVGVLQISNASPFDVVRDRGPEVVFDSAAVPVSYAPTGWSVLKPGEVEQVLTESLTNGIGWRLVVYAQRLGDDPYGIAAEPRLRKWHGLLAVWLQIHGVKVTEPSPPPGRVFSTAWIDP